MHACKKKALKIIIFDFCITFFLSCASLRGNLGCMQHTLGNPEVEQPLFLAMVNHSIGPVQIYLI